MPDPMWRRIAEDLRQKIESGELGGEGSALPSPLELQDTHQASRNTVRDAVKWLVTRGLVVTRGFDESGQPFRVTITSYPADRNQFVMTAGELPLDYDSRQVLGDVNG